MTKTSYFIHRIGADTEWGCVILILNAAMRDMASMKCIGLNLKHLMELGVS